MTTVGIIRTSSVFPQVQRLDETAWGGTSAPLLKRRSRNSSLSSLGDYSVDTPKQALNNLALTHPDIPGRREDAAESCVWRFRGVKGSRMRTPGTGLKFGWHMPELSVCSWQPGVIPRFCGVEFNPCGQRSWRQHKYVWQPGIRITWSSWFISIFPTFKIYMITGRYFTVLRKASVQWKTETHAQSQSKKGMMRTVTTYVGRGGRCYLARDLEVLTSIGPLWQPGEASGTHLRMIFLMK